MKGFIEVTTIDDTKKKSQKIIININHIIRVSSAENTYYKSLIDDQQAPDSMNHQSGDLPF